MPKGNQAGFYREGGAQIDGALVREWFEDPVAVLHYVRAAVSIGLWVSEARLLSQVFSPGQRILDLGCGAGRIAIGLWRLGFRRVTGVDFAPAMIEAAREVASAKGAEVSFAVGDATALALPPRSFDGAIFGFNGLMQIPGRENRRRALSGIGRVVMPGGRFVFTSHDRDLATAGRGSRANGDALVSGTGELEPGDRVGVLPEGRIFMHWPDRKEVLEDLAATGWMHLEDHLRSHLANEPEAVRAFSDECRFWVCARPHEAG